MEGPLSKWTNVMKGWQYRWFVLDDSAGLLSYYTSKERMVRGARRGCVRLKGAVVGIDDEDDSTFTVTVDGKMFHFQAHDTVERERWLRALEDTILRHTNSSLYGYKWSNARHPPTLQDFDRKLTESDAYLQLLIEQVKDLDVKISSVPDEKEKNQLILVRDNANAVLEAIKHSIVLLQIAKNTTHPVNGVFQPGVLKNELGQQNNNYRKKEYFATSGPENEGDQCDPEAESLEGSTDSLRSGDLTSKETKVPDGSEPRGAGRKKSNPIQPPRELGSGLLEHFVPTSSSGAPLNLIVPETSYSSSDDEDFFDATEDVLASAAQSPNNPCHFESSVASLERDEELLRAAKTLGPQQPNNFIYPDGTINYDAIYEDEEEELGSIEGQGSVITHLLSQVKIGMDLTKVVLPTFILERRSLLEMYADFFAHPDIFVSIPDYEDPKDRMVQVVRWYLSAFHAGRKSSVAKKPYNPILGETFRCLWDVQGKESTPEKVADGPVPWAHRNQLTFIAEQVSHHPPISAFYAEHYNQGISACAHIWTKSKFLGLSIGVHNIGQGCVSVLKYDEEYIITFPNGYGRSILTVPWIELGGEISITCSKTGYLANIEFQTKPFYGGKKHRVTADIFQPGEKKPFVNISGEWNGLMTAKWASGQSEVFVDTKSIPIVKKVVSPIVEQEPYESRNLWKNVTAALMFRNVQVATDSKSILEHKQREEARVRRETRDKWETRVFHELGEHWVYDSPLQKRLKRSQSQDSTLSHPP